jgi:hypothetical protein
MRVVVVDEAETATALESAFLHIVLNETWRSLSGESGECDAACAIA